MRVAWLRYGPVGSNSVVERRAVLPASSALPSSPRRVEKAAEPQQSLRRDRGGGAVDRLAIVERIGRPRSPVAERREAWRAGVPVGDAVGARGDSM